MTPPPEDRERRMGAAVIHVCTQADTIAGLVEWQKRQNGSLGDISKSVSILLDRVPHDLDQRLRKAENSAASREGVIRFAKWGIGIGGLSGWLMLLTLLLGKNGILHGLWQTVGGG